MLGNILSSMGSVVSLNPIIFIILGVMLFLMALVYKRGRSIAAIKDSHMRRTELMRHNSYSHVPPIV